MITLSKLAKLANVSISTASKAFSGSREVNAQTRAEIFSVAKELGVFKKFYNVKYPRLVVAVIVPEFHSRNYGPLLSEIQRVLEDRGCSMTVTPAGFLPFENNKIYDYYSKYTDVDGIIVIGEYDHSGDELDIPCVVIGSENLCGNICGIRITSRAATFDAISYLKASGAVSVGFISEPKTLTKLSYFTDAMTKIYGTVDEKYVIVTKNRFEEGGYEGMKKLIEAGNLPRAVLCGYDNMAYGAVRCLKDFGFRVPQDVAVIGYDDNAESEYIFPSLSSINVKHKECAVAAADTLMKIILTQPHSRVITINAEFKPRESSKI